jgi:NADH-quinone oxidoreductase subunit C
MSPEEVEKEEKKPELKSEILDAIKKRFSNIILDAEIKKERRLVVIIDREHLLEVCKYLYDLGFDHLSNISGVEYEDRFESVYHLWSYSNYNLLALKAIIPKDSPKIASVTSIWKSADWHERESYDLMGIVYEGHPNLTRILNSDDFKGHPLRKDFKLVENPWFEEK